MGKRRSRRVRSLIPNVTAPAIQKGKTAKPGKARRLWWILGLLALVIVGAFIAWRNGGREAMLLALQPGFQVMKVDQAAQTMLVTRLNETYLVRCAQSCDLFDVGKTYKMRMQAGGLEVVRKGQRLALPILEEHIEFETPPGGHG